MQEQEDNGRQAQLRIAAEALVEWVHARRATWSDEPLSARELVDFSDLAGIVGEAEPSSWSPPVAEPPASWSPPVVAPPVFNQPPPVFAETLPVVAVAPPPDDSLVTFDMAAILDAEAEVPETNKPQRTLRLPTAALGAFAAPLISLARRAAPIAVLLAVVVGVGWMAGPYVSKVKTWMTEATNEAPPPKAERIEPKPKAAKGGGARTGQLSARSDPPGATVLVDGRDRGVTPLTLDVAIGSHTVVLQSEKGSVRRSVTVGAERPAVVSEAIFAGWLSVFAPFELQITEGTHVIRLDDNGKVLLPPGPHELRLANRDLGYEETRRIDVQPGQTTSVSLVTPPSTLTVTASGQAFVSIDGKQVGETPLTNQPIALGTRDIVVTSADGTERQFTRKVTVAPVQIDVDFSKP